MNSLNRFCLDRNTTIVRCTRDCVAVIGTYWTQFVDPSRSNIEVPCGVDAYDHFKQDANRQRGDTIENIDNIERFCIPPARVCSAEICCSPT